MKDDEPRGGEKRARALKADNCLQSQWRAAKLLFVYNSQIEFKAVLNKVLFIMEWLETLHKNIRNITLLYSYNAMVGNTT